MEKTRFICVPNSTGGKMKILLVDDEPRWIKFIKSVFGKMVDISLSVKDNGYDLIILSSRMLDKAQDIKDDFIIVTGQPTTKEAIKAYRLGAKDYISKDFRESVILRKCMDVINESKAKMD